MKISAVELEDADELANMYEQYLNGGTCLREHVRESIGMKDYVGYKIIDHGQIQGFFTGRPGFDLTYPHPELERKIKDLFQGEPFFSNESILILPDYRHHGLAKTLGEYMVEAIRKKGYHLLLAELWAYPDGTVPADKMTLHWGEVVYEEKISHFYKQLKQYGMTCPVCGEQCVCGAVIRVFRL